MMKRIKNSYYKLRSFIAYFNIWGYSGFKVFLNLRKGNVGEILQIEVKECEFPIYVRAKSSDVYSFEDIFAHLSYEVDLEIDVNIIIDLGANAGHSGVYFANKYPLATIVSVEPDSENLSLMTKNLENYANVELIHSAIWNKKCRLKIINTEASKWAFRVCETDETDENGFDSISINEIVSEFNLTSIDILKIDIEGAEFELFSENYNKWLSITKCILIELHDRFRPGCSKVFYDAISSRDYKSYRSGENIVILFD